MPNPALANHRTGDACGARIGFVVLVVGGLWVLLAGIRATPRYRPTDRSHRQNSPAVTACRRRLEPRAGAGDARGTFGPAVRRPGGGGAVRWKPRSSHPSDWAGRRPS